MAAFKIYKLHFTSPLHISNQHDDNSVSMKTIHSDTLYAALMACLGKTGQPIPSDGNLGFCVSSLFPYYQESKDKSPIYFLPMPLQTKLPRLSNVSDAKRVKKVEWIDSSLYEKVLFGMNIFEEQSYIDLIQGSYLTPYQLPENTDGTKNFIHSEVAQRVTISDRSGQSEAMPYYVDRIVFKDLSGLYFIVNGDTKQIDQALKILSNEGIGTDRNVGFGYFDYSSDTMNLNVPQQAEHLISLSLFIPESKEQLEELMNSESVAYDVIRRGGWITTYPFMNLRKNAIYGFTPGSVFKRIYQQADFGIGKIVDLKPILGDMTPDHPIWRNGRSITLPITIKN